MIRANLVHHSGVPIWVEAPTIDAIEILIKTLLAKGYRVPASASGGQYQRTPTGDPLCPKHGVPLHKRDRQGDAWFSHAIQDPQGKTRYCRGHAWKPGDGWEV